ncbi:hypothetical protein ACHAWX_000120, partial [Stephanocyclus meneghinianus]
MSAIASTSTIVLLSTCSFVGIVGAALTGFGHAIIFLFVWQIVDLAGYDGDFKYAMFVQSLSLLSMQPLLLRNAQVVKNAFRPILLLFVPITLVSTPVGQLVSVYVPTRIVQAVAGVLVTLVAVWELYSKRNWFRACWRKAKGSRIKEVHGNDNAGGKAVSEMCQVALAAKMEKDRHFEENQERAASNNPEPEVELTKNCGIHNLDLSANEETLQIHQTTKTEMDDNVEDYEKVDERRNVNNQEETSNPDRCNDTDAEGELKIIGCNKATWYTLLAGGTSGFLGGMVAIPGPALIFYFLHPPYPVTFSKKSQRATGVVITFCNVLKIGRAS